MTQQYWVGDFCVDLSRNQITQNNQTQTLAPKALLVLTYLAKNKGQVVSHDDLLTEVWPGSVVSPNTLQKNIAQLRKALGDDGKGQTYIKTHAKQGYSLECDVRWGKAIEPSNTNNAEADISHPPSLSQTDTNTARATVTKPTSSNLIFSRPLLIVGIIILFITGYLMLQPKQITSLTFDQLTLLTATDDKEFDATYSPDGQYVVFHRYLDKLCVNKIWAKDTKTQKEIQLTKNWGAYGSHSFSKDGKKLIFLATAPCDQPQSQKSCFDLVSLDFEKALQNPEQPSTILQCKNSAIKSPVWLNNNNIALLQKTSKRWKLISYSVSENKSTDLFEVEQGNLIGFKYSAKDDQLAVVSILNDEQYAINILKPDGQVLSSHPIQYPKEIPKYRPLYPNFSPLDNQLIFSTGRQLFTLSYDGKITKLSSPFADTMQQPVFHPNGKKLLMIKGPYDSDIVKLSLAQLTNTSHLTQTERRQSYTSFERSNLGDADATFQPNGELIAFWSKRSGQAQLWISDGHTAEQLTRFPMDTYIRGFDWAADGKSLLVNANSELTVISLDSTQQTLALDYPVIRLLQWNSKQNSALLVLSIEGVITFVDYDLTHLTYKKLTDKNIGWALRSDDGHLIYKDHMEQFWQSGPVEPQLIRALDQQSGKSKSFVLKNNVLYAINYDNQLWSYHLDTKAFKIIGLVSDNVDYLTDVNQNEILMTIQVSAKKEVVELSLSQ